MGAHPTKYVSIMVGEQVPRFNGENQATTGWWYTYPSEKREFFSLDDESPNMIQYMENKKCSKTTKQLQYVEQPTSYEFQ